MKKRSSNGLFATKSQIHGKQRNGGRHEIRRRKWKPTYEIHLWEALNQKKKEKSNVDEMNFLVTKSHIIFNIHYIIDIIMKVKSNSPLRFQIHFWTNETVKGVWHSEISITCKIHPRVFRTFSWTSKTVRSNALKLTPTTQMSERI